MADDKERRVRDEIVSVLEEFQVPYTLTSLKRHAAVMFDVNGKHLTMTYSGGDPRAHLNARADIRRTLLMAGAVIPERHHKPFNGIDVPPPPVIDITEPVIEIMADPEPEPEIVEPPPAIEPEVPPVAEEASPLRLNRDDLDYLIYQPRRLVPNKCLVIEIEKDLLVEKGHVVIVPLDKPTLIPMSREMFDGMFTTIFAQQPQPIPQPVPPPPVPPMPAEEEIEEEAELPHVAKEEPSPFRFTRVPEGVSGLKPQRPAPAPKAPKGERTRANNIIYTPYRDLHPRSIDGVSPQLARILAAMMYVSDLRHKADLEPSMMDDYLLPHDKKQFAARMIGARRLGVIEQGLPMPNRPNSYHVKITTAGRKITRKLKGWPWLYDGQEVPSWVQTA